MIPGTEVSCTVAAAEGVDTDAQQGQTDGHNDTGGNDVAQVLTPVLCSQAQGTFDTAADHDRADQAFIAVQRIGSDAQHGSQEGEGAAHDDGQLGADLPDGVQLDGGADTGGEHAALQDACDLGGGELTGAAVNQGSGHDDQDGNQVCNEHCQNMLQAEGNGLTQGNTAVQLVDVVNAHIVLGGLFFH